MPQRREFQSAWNKLTKVKRKIGKFTIIVTQFSGPFTVNDRASTQKIRKDVDSNITSDRDLTDIYSTLYLKTAKEYLFSSAFGTFTIWCVIKWVSINIKH